MHLYHVYFPLIYELVCISHVPLACPDMPISYYDKSGVGGNISWIMKSTVNTSALPPNVEFFNKGNDFSHTAIKIHSFSLK